MKLSNVDYQVLAAGLRENAGFHYATRWYLDWEPLGYQYAFHHIPIKNTSFLAGIGCVAGNTLILSPDGNEVSIADLAKKGELIDVVAWTGAEFAPTKASQPFLKGRADLYEVALADGRKVTVTLEHRFLTPNGYEPLANIHVGQRIGVRPTQDHSTHGEDDAHCPEILQDYQEYSHRYFHRNDGLLHLELGSGLVSAPLLGDAPGYSRLNSFQDAQSEPGRERIHLCRSCAHPSRKGCALHEEPRQTGELRQSSRSNPVSLLGRSLQHSPQSDHSSFPETQGQLDAALSVLGDFFAIPAAFDLEKHPYSFPGSYEYAPNSRHLSRVLSKLLSTFPGESVPLPEFPALPISSSCKYPFNTSYEHSDCSTDVLFMEIKSVKWTGHGDFYDIVVPGPNSYVGNGIIHHNSGKTMGVTASNIIDCISLPGFRALNASITAKQAELAFQMLDTWRENISRFGNLITDIGLRPYPQVTFWNGSTYEFRTAGQGAKFIRGSEYDRINYDEPGLDPNGEAIRVLRGRLRGKRPDGSYRMARLDVTGTPTAAQWFRERFENGLVGGQFSSPETLKFYRSMRITTYDNTHLTTEQIALIEAEYPPEMVAVEMRAEWPDFGISTFPHGHIQACIDRNLNDDMEVALRPENGTVKAGYEEEEWPRIGHVFWKVPVKPGHLYIMAGDPGVDTPPRRNSPCIMCFDITTMPAEMVYFHWASGRGSYDPFLQSYKRAVEEYRPIAKGIDATGTQKALSDLGFEKVGIQMDSIHFGGQKDELINSLLVAITSHDLKFPSIQGLISQLQTYNRDDDKDVAQDLVMTIAQIAYLMRRATGDTRVKAPSKNNYFNRLQRTTNAGRIR